MLNILPAALHRLLLRTAHGLRLRWWRLTGKTVHGCNVIAINDLGQVLLVRHSYHSPDLWMLPGGGLDKGESLLDAACRELHEEVGCTLNSPMHLHTTTLDRGRWSNIIAYVAGSTSDVPSPDGREIAAARFFDPDALPHPISTPVEQVIALLREAGSWDQNGSSV